MNQATTMQVWVDDKQIERPIARFETKKRVLFGGCPEIVQEPVPEVNAGEVVVRWRNRVLIVRRNESHAH
jgi:hypothetical protein